MTSRQTVSDFLAQRKLALVGMSRKRGKFGNAVHKELTARGYTVYPVHPEAGEIDGHRCWPDLASLPEPVGGLVVVVPPPQAEEVVRDAARTGIPRVWMQQGSESPGAIQFCEEQGIAAVHRECILMFVEPAAFVHRAHRWVWGILGKLPE
jgi:uncharacterized protein